MSRPRRAWPRKHLPIQVCEGCGERWPCTHEREQQLRQQRLMDAWKITMGNGR